MRRAWSTTLKCLAVALVLAGRFEPTRWLGLLAAAAALTGLVLDFLDWHHTGRPPWPRLIGGALTATLAGWFLAAVWSPAVPSYVPPVEVPEFGFKLRQPGDGWTLLSKADLPSPPHVVEVQAGADSGDGVLGVVLAAPLAKYQPIAAEPNLFDLARIHRATIPWENLEVIEEVEFFFVSKRALRYRVAGVENGRPMVGQAVLVVHRQNLVILASVGPQETTKANDPRFAAFMGAVEFQN